MEGAETFFLSAASGFKLDIFAYDIINRCVIADVLNILILYATGHIPTLSNYRAGERVRHMPQDQSGRRSDQ